MMVRRGEKKLRHHILSLTAIHSVYFRVESWEGRGCGDAGICADINWSGYRKRRR